MSWCVFQNFHEVVDGGDDGAYTGALEDQAAGALEAQI
jgi:hypothetical protein